MNISRQEQQDNFNLKYEREIRGWSQDKLAEKVGVTPRTVSRWERGKSIPHPCYREKLCQLFGRNTQELGFLRESSFQASGLAPLPLIEIEDGNRITTVQIRFLLESPKLQR
jgi:transcriptional regulator with XRE-family HTH domain